MALNARAGAAHRSRTVPGRDDLVDPVVDEPINTEGLRLVVDLTEDADPKLEVDLRPYLTSDAGLLTAPHWQLRIKRMVDIVASAFFLVVFSPILLVTAIAVLTTSPGPVIFKQDRIGKDGRAFEFYKFRSMRATAESERVKLLSHNEKNGPIFKIEEDPRITRVGRFIRRTSIDELPQIWNVLRGDMSLVGPRPPLPVEVAEYSAWERQRLTVRPGVTGIWQVSGRSDIDFETWVAMDVEYIEEWSPSLDTSLMVRTIPAVLSGRGAY